MLTLSINTYANVILQPTLMQMLDTYEENEKQKEGVLCPVTLNRGMQSHAVETHPKK